MRRDRYLDAIWTASSTSSSVKLRCVAAWGRSARGKYSSPCARSPRFSPSISALILSRSGRNRFGREGSAKCVKGFSLHLQLLRRNGHLARRAGKQASNVLADTGDVARHRHLVGDSDAGRDEWQAPLLIIRCWAYTK